MLFDIFSSLRAPTFLHRHDVLRTPFVSYAACTTSMPWMGPRGLAICCRGRGRSRQFFRRVHGRLWRSTSCKNKLNVLCVSLKLDGRGSFNPQQRASMRQKKIDRQIEKRRFAATCFSCVSALSLSLSLSLCLSVSVICVSGTGLHLLKGKRLVVQLI